MVEASEFLIAHAETPLRRSSAAGVQVAFLYQRGKLDDAVQRYEKRLEADADDVTALIVLTKLYERPRKNTERAAELSARLAKIEQQLARARAEKLEQDAGFATQLAGVYWKDAALAWLDADDKDRAKAAAEKALAAGEDGRNEQLAHYWHRALADVFLAVGDPQQAIPRYQSALELTTIEGYKQQCRTKLAEAEAALKSAP
jgi:tetratricopeptide (TPR) repeat protein